VVRIRADNPGPMTLDGTNTWLVRAAGTSAAVVIDPGPALASHLDRVRGQLRDAGVGVAAVLLTHGHLDHSAGAAEFARGVAAPLRAFDAGMGTGAALVDGEVLELDGWALEVLHTPGHSSDSVTFAADGYFFTGDTVLGRGTTVVAHPDGRLTDYYSSLRLLRARADEVRALLPGHGPVVADPSAWLDHYLAHRDARLAAVAAVADRSHSRAGLGALSAAEVDELTDAVVAEVYADVPREVWPAAALSVKAQLLHLAELGE
jgi:glyoxylase-like metal-dependent hydrolase (beta-lactamase superfamily II)